MYGDESNTIIKEDEELYGEYLETVGKKSKLRSIPYTDIYE